MSYFTFDITHLSTSSTISSHHPFGIPSSDDQKKEADILSPQKKIVLVSPSTQTERSSPSSKSSSYLESPISISLNDVKKDLTKKPLFLSVASPTVVSSKRTPHSTNSLFSPSERGEVRISIQLLKKNLFLTDISNTALSCIFSYLVPKNTRFFVRNKVIAELFSLSKEMQNKKLSFLQEKTDELFPYLEEAAHKTPNLPQSIEKLFWDLRNIETIEFKSIQFHERLFAPSETLQSELLANSTSCTRFFSWLCCRKVESNTPSVVGIQDIVHYFPRIKTLILKNSLLQEKSYLYLSQLQDITTLDLSDICTLQDRNFKHIGQLTKLKKLSIRNCPQLSSSAIFYLNTCHQLTELDISGSFGIDKKAITEIAKLTCICTLNLSDCYDIDDNSLLLISQLPYLRHLYLRTCVLINTNGIRALQNIPSLETLDLSCCPYISNTEIKMICASHPKLKKLYISELSISNDTLSYIASLKKLTVLDISDCKKLKPDAILALKKQTSLRSLFLSASHQFTKESLDVLKKYNPLLTIQLL